MYMNVLYMYIFVYVYIVYTCVCIHMCVWVYVYVYTMCVLVPVERVSDPLELELRMAVSLHVILGTEASLASEPTLRSLFRVFFFFF